MESNKSLTNKKENMGIWTAAANAAKTTFRKGGQILTVAVKHPKQTMLAGAGSYAGWQYIANDRPLIDSAGDMAGKAADVTFGEKRVDKAEEVVKGTATAVTDTIDAAGEKINSATEAITGAADTAKEATSALSGVSSFFQGLTSGNGLGMIGNFFRNLATGNVGGLGIAGLIGAAILCFGRVGFLGKLLGGLLAMMVIGNNFRPSVGQSAQPRVPQPHTEPVQSPVQTHQVEETPVQSLHRGR